MTTLQRDQLNNKWDFFGSDRLLCDLRLAASDQDLEHLVNFAYTDYGGEFMDKVCIDYFLERYPENIVVETTDFFGRNAFLFGEVAREYIEATQNYPLGFEDLEEYYYTRTAEVELDCFAEFLHQLSDTYLIHIGCYAWLSEHKAGYYSITPQGVDFSANDLRDELIGAGMISPLDDDQENLNLVDVVERYPFHWN